MKTCTAFVCEKCGKISLSREEIEVCESSHYNLSIDDYRNWIKLKEAAASMGSKLFRTNNVNTRKMFDESIDELLNFERSHGLVESL